ncbi:SMR family transporter [Leptospira sp. WS58.C1]|jgi:multidrug transporter EmrE-like cation transporter|uniref:SMR family transporter n=1 Tax=Leptospira TaxID=171 RepID=UPI00055D2574|nr:MULTISPECIES: SMR family transporter [unclassified Leptospira]MCR1792813.1 cation transporter [Leptospira sp. id769339]
MKLTVIIIFVVALFFNALANILIKASSLGDKTDTASGIEGLIKAFLHPVFFAGLVSFGIALLGYRWVLGNGLKLSLAYPLFTSAGFIIVLVASAIFFKEELNWTQWTGIGLILAGVWLTSAEMFA